MYTQAQLQAALRNRAKPAMTEEQVAAHDAELAAYDAYVAEHGVLCEVTGQYVSREQANENLAAWDKPRTRMATFAADVAKLQGGK